VERESSEKLRSDIDCFLRTSAKEMWNRFNQVNTAILARIQEVTNARNRLQIQLEKVRSTHAAITYVTEYTVHGVVAAQCTGWSLHVSGPTTKLVVVYNK